MPRPAYLPPPRPPAPAAKPTAVKPSTTPLQNGQSRGLSRTSSHSDVAQELHRLWLHPLTIMLGMWSKHTPHASCSRMLRRPMEHAAGGRPI